MVCLQPLWRNWPAKQSNSVRKRKIRAITPLKVIQGHRGRYQSKSPMRLPISEWLIVADIVSRSCRFGVLAAYCWNFWHFAFLSHLLGGLETTYDVHLGLIGNRVVDFLLVLTELFSLSRTTEELRAKIHRKSAISLQRGHALWPKISGRRCRLPHHVIFAQIVIRPMNVLQFRRWQFSHKETVYSTLFIYTLQRATAPLTCHTVQTLKLNQQ